MKKFFSLIICLSFILVLGGCSGSGSDAPEGSTLSITPSDTLTVESASSVIESANQVFLITARDVPPVAPPPTPTTTTAAATTPSGPGIRNVTFSITFEYSNPPDQSILPDMASAVTLCDGTRIINKTVDKMTDNDGNYSLCISYKAGGGLVYSGALRVTSGDQSPSVKIDVKATPQGLAVSPATQTIPAGSLAQFTIVGGIPRYTITPNPASILPPVPSTVVSSGGTFTVAVPVGTPDKSSVIYTITDAVGAQVTATLTVGPPATLPQVFPSASNVLPGGSAQFTIVGGYPGYTVTSDNPLVPPVPSTVAASGGTFTVTIPINISPSLYAGTISFTVRDSAGSVVANPVKVTILKPVDLSVTPPSVTADPGSSIQFTILGGIPGYTVTSDTPSVAPVPSTVAGSGGTFRITIPITTPAGTINLNVTDAVGQTKSVAVTVASPPPIVITPSTVNVTAGESVQFSVVGGVPGYAIATSDASIVPVPSLVTASGGTFRVFVPTNTPTESVTVTVTDQTGKSASAALVVTAAPVPLRITPSSPAPISAAVGGTVPFTISGGTSPYVTTSFSTDTAHIYFGTPGTVTATGPSIILTVLPGAQQGVVSLSTVDSVGNSVTATVTVNP